MESFPNRKGSGRSRGRPSAGPPYSPSEAANLDHLLEKRGWTAEAFYEEFRRINPREEITLGHFRKLITPNGDRKPLKQSTRNAIARTFDAAPEIFDRFLLTCDFALLAKSGTSSDALRDGENANSHATLDFFADCFLGVSLVELRGTDAEKELCLTQGSQRLNDHPQDVFFRAVITWAALRCGTPEKARWAFQQIAVYVSPTSSIPPEIEVDVSAWKETIRKIETGRIAEPEFARRHLEDALHRASLFHWLKCGGKHSPLAHRLSAMALQPQTSSAIAAILNVARSAGIDKWMATTIQQVYSWFDREYSSALALSLLLWLTGRQGNPDALPKLIDRACRWLDQNPRSDDPFVRWGIIWLSGMDDYRVDHVLSRTRAWLQTEAAKKDHFVRLSLLWLAGARGSELEIQEIERDILGWLAEPMHEKDGCLRIGWLLWLMRRSVERQIVSPDRLDFAIADTDRWLKSHSDVLVELALMIAKQFRDELSIKSGIMKP